MKDADRDLLRAAEEARSRAYAPYSGYHVGAAILGSNGTIYTGVNVENASYGATICAERTAAVKAVEAGCTSFEAIAIAADGARPMPCGICRQFLSEFAPTLRVIVADEKEPLILRLNDLLPYSFTLETEIDKTK